MDMLAIIRRAVACAVIATAAAPALAASPEEAYVAARDAAIARFKVLDDERRIDDAAMKLHDETHADLEKLMRAIIGPVTIKGLSTSGTLNLSTLVSSDQGFGTLDGLVFASADDKTRVIVTTESIFAAWLKAHRNWWGDKIANVPQDAAAAVKSDAFYTQAIQSDAAVMRYAELPLAKRANARIAFAMLAARSQDNSPPVPDEIFVTTMQGGRLFVANAPLRGRFVAIRACDEVRRRQERLADEAYAVYQAGGNKDEKQFDRSTALREQADTLFLRCFAREAPKQAAFAGAVKQAQALLDSLPAR
jgi:hypothetical protein